MCAKGGRSLISLGDFSKKLTGKIGNLESCVEKEKEKKQIFKVAKSCHQVTDKIFKSHIRYKAISCNKVTIDVYNFKKIII